ncbi:MAG: hypothetical protein KUA35_16685 [Pseudodesulfovibrio sp.]|uniref:DUF3800 domain-containing protein n=1 Tax=Pseudodesulfovibrio aespoeensis (strain ATCC 700646 / DSM 10631 / Aspo-2) TaxID=643562 RepID=E6VVN6_PSEA9|nr:MULTISPECIES: hypothetical protein [Pseudodesulfovibrio]MBU4192541.1 hypothetical protein [Pseudomonadota bacterium]ADU63594.1 hypothetical protein Daes_2596 [Pseudodesulfovibrio aespoeensis Aspo-2]MBU4244758.1 hypothetical protein [Pseudomonadota bacterium]MBU4378843.1 hypothetical protein [Pseudomonadota bacterium]MBU4475297.1 hypothetical protein [Pseudomonadota bacterium]
MQIMLTDETNRRPSERNKFFIYGGIVMPVEALSGLDEGINEIRERAGYKSTDILKFDTNARPEQVSIADCTEAKRQVIALCNELECKFIVHIILHAIIRNQDQDQHVKWAADFVIGRYNKFLRLMNEDGICVIDNLPNMGQWQYLGEKFCTGLHLPNGNRQLDRIKLFSATCVEASHANSAMDIVLGSFRYCVNDPQNREAAREMLNSVVPLVWTKTLPDGTKTGSGRGLIFRPPINEIRVDSYRQEYQTLIDNLNTLQNEPDEDE